MSFVANAVRSSFVASPWGESSTLNPVVRIRDQEIENCESRAKEIASGLGISLITATLLLCRGAKNLEDAKAFLYPTLKDHLPDPSTACNMLKAAELILDSIVNEEIITIYCDFDVDGLSSGSQLYLYLKALGTRVQRYVPNRFTEGYGLIKSAIQTIGASGCRLLIALDCGTTSSEELGFARKLGLTTIVVDHHQWQVDPGADVLVNPTQPGCPFHPYGLSAAGLTWMLLIVLRRVVEERQKNSPQAVKYQAINPPDPKDYLDLAALGTICDMVPLRTVNRLIAARGLELLRDTKRVGLIALKEICGFSGDRQITTGHVGFALGPRINAAGRINYAKDVFELLTTENMTSAKKLASSLDRQNTKRQMIEERVRQACLNLISGNPSLLNLRALTFYEESFHLGVIGIVAQRLSERFLRPAVVMAPGEVSLGGKSARVIKGSVRGAPGFHVAEALKSLNHLLISGGGHEQAGGFSLSPEKLFDFQAGFVAEAERMLGSELPARKIVVDTEVNLSEIDYPLVFELSLLSPFGLGNQSPVFISRDLTVETVTPLSKGHIRFRVSQGDSYANAVGWNFQGHPLIRKGERINLTFQAEINNYQGVSSVQLQVKDVW